MPKENLSPQDALRIALDEAHFSLYKTYDLSRAAAFLAALSAKLMLEVNGRIERGEAI